MTRITGDEPAHWHDENGRHRMPDPRRIPGWKRSDCNPDEKGYWDHLEAHDNAPLHRSDDDPPQVTALFDLIESKEREIAVSRELIAVLRKKAEIDKHKKTE